PIVVTVVQRSPASRQNASRQINVVRPRFPRVKQRIKSFCGAKPTQKLRWMDAWVVSMSPAMEISPETSGVRADHRG
ncbi:hypothetical protein Q8G41_28140, partial [Klebsiella pneumoniae]|uniref:hypothetical protein n=1 Tax=Klebsiella pneumoniae TaxID=573 RepID=UPI003014061C